MPMRYLPVGNIGDEKIDSVIEINYKSHAWGGHTLIGQSWENDDIYEAF